jgi:hypothetical protein
MLAFPDMLHLFPNEFSGLGGRGFTFPRVFPRPFKSFLFRHRASCELESTFDSVTGQNH